MALIHSPVCIVMTREGHWKTILGVLNVPYDDGAYENKEGDENGSVVKSVLVKPHMSCITTTPKASPPHRNHPNQPLFSSSSSVISSP